MDLKLQSNDGKEFEINQNVASISGYLRESIEEMEANDSPEFQLDSIASNELERILSFCNHHQEEQLAEIETPVEANTLDEIVSPWYANFVELETEELCLLLRAAYYLDIKPLQSLVAAKIAIGLRGLKPEEIRDKFDIKNDFTPEEAAVVHDLNGWPEEP